MKASISKFQGIHDGARIAILGSAPTIHLYHKEEDYSIAVNGAIMCVDTSDYFMCGDKISHNHLWFKPSQERGGIRIIAAFIAPYDKIVIPNDKERKKLKNRLENSLIHQREGGGNIRFSPKFRYIQDPNGVFEYADIWEEEICPTQQRLCRGGTISGVAAQMAKVMGAGEIHLYGCPFKTLDKGHYGYDNRGEIGRVGSTQPATMDYILSRLRHHGTKIFSHGESALTIPERVE